MARTAAPDMRRNAWLQLGMKPGPVLRVFGMRRSGNHAVINWLSRNAPGGQCVFLNNCAVGKNPFESFRAIEVNGRRSGKPGDDPKPIARRAGDGAALILSYEDIMPIGQRNRPISTGIDDSTISHEVIICRSFLNWAASMVKKLQGNKGYAMHDRVVVLLRSVGLYSGMLDLVTGGERAGLSVIRYDDWMDDPAYRADRLARLGFEQRDDSLGKVQRYGNGSSFQPGEATAEELNTRNRWREMQSDAEYRIVLWIAAQDQALCDKLHRVFPDDAAQLAKMTGAPPVIAGPEQAAVHSQAPLHILRRN